MSEKDGFQTEQINLKPMVLRGTFWLFLEKGGLGLLEFAVSWVLARFFLFPSDYTLVGISAIFIGFCNLFSQGSFNNALVQRADIDENDRSTVFWLSFGASVLFYLLLFFLAPVIAGFYGYPELTILFRVQALSLIFDGLCVVQTALLTKNIRFDTVFFKTFLAVIVSSVLAVGAAVAGWGAWAIVIQTLSVSVLGCVFLWIAVGWKPKRIFSGKSVAKLWGFGSTMYLSNVINNVYSNTLPAAMEVLYAPSTLGYYNKARTIPAKVSESVTGTLNSIVFPSLSLAQDDPKKVKEMTRKFLMTGSFVMFAAMAGLIAVARPLILFLYTDRWEGSIVFTQFLCATLAFVPLDSANLQAVKALGKGGIYLTLEIIKDVSGFAVLVAAMILTANLEHGLYWVMGVQVLLALVSVAVNAWPNRKLMNYPLWEQLRDVAPTFLLAAVMGAAVFAVTLLGLPNWLTLLIQVPLGIGIYLGGAALFRFESLRDLMGIVRTVAERKKRS